MTRLRTTAHPPWLLRSVLAALILAAVPGIDRADGWDINRLMQSLAQVESSHASFVERKSIAMLEEPVVSSGELSYVAPDHLEKRTLKPKPESMILDDDTLVIEHGGKERRLALHDHPELAAFIDGIRGTLAGDRETLERHYRLTLQGTADRWTLQLLPVGEKIREVIKRIRITGTGSTLHKVKITQADGDSSVMVIEKSAEP